MKTGRRGFIQAALAAIGVNAGAAVPTVSPKPARLVVQPLVRTNVRGRGVRGVGRRRGMVTVTRAFPGLEDHLARCAARKEPVFMSAGVGRLEPYVIEQLVLHEDGGATLHLIHEADMESTPATWKPIE